MNKEVLLNRLFRIGQYYIVITLVIIVFRQYSPVVFKSYTDNNIFSMFTFLSVPIMSLLLVILDFFKNRENRYWGQSILIGITVSGFSIVFTFVIGVITESSAYREQVLYQHKYLSDHKIMLEQNYSTQKTRVVQVSDFTPWFQLIQKIDTLKINPRRWDKSVEHKTLIIEPRL